VYLKLVIHYFLNDHDFNLNFGIALAFAGDYKAAEEGLCKFKMKNIRAITSTLVGCAYTT
jgi:hypothetical protein